MALLTSAGAFTEAVELALQVDIALAKATADKPEEDQALRRALWLRCAQHVIRRAQEAGAEGSPLKRAIEFLSETDGLLRIEDVLPFFPDVTKIDDFKVRGGGGKPLAQPRAPRDSALAGDGAGTEGSVCSAP